jgi:5,10-methenyltetrahydrofolate synthetase
MIPITDKRELRKWAARQRAELDAAWRAQASAAAAQNVIGLIDQTGAKTVALFASFNDEIDTHELIRALVDRDIRVALPLVVRGEPAGMATFAIIRPGRRYDHRDLALFMEVAARLSIAIENARLYDDLREQAEELRRSNDAKD